MVMDSTDERILDLLQNEFPLEQRPYEILAEKAGLSADEFLERTQKLSRAGIIRRIGLSLSSGKLGYDSTLAAVKVAPERIEKACGVIDKFPEITHSYLRDDEFNIWFTVIAHNEQRIEEILAEIRSALSLPEEELLNLPVIRLFKLDARFDSQNRNCC